MDPSFPNIPSQLFIAVGAVLAAVITSAISLVSLLVSKEQKISEFRQEWINSLRGDLAQFAANARVIALRQAIPSLAPMYPSFISQIEAVREELLRPDPYHANLTSLAQAYYSIRLRLNQGESDHNLVLEKLGYVYEALGAHESDRFEKTTAALDHLAEASQSALKREWKRVKRGEQGYFIATLVAFFVGAFLLVALTYVMLEIRSIALTSLAQT